jgi:hypothetical protein
MSNSFSPLQNLVSLRSGSHFAVWFALTPDLSPVLTGNAAAQPFQRLRFRMFGPCSFRPLRRSGRAPDCRDTLFD